METAVGKIDVKLDRITLTGNLLITNQELIKIMGEMVEWQLQPDYKADCPWWRLVRRVSDEVYETVAVFMKNQFQSSWRLDTSNHLENDQEKMSIIRIVMLLERPHLTRIDIAFDFINCKYAGMRHVLVKPGTTTTNYKDLQAVDFRGRSGAYETKYLGKRRSLSMVRYYDKLVEQARAHTPIPKDIESWERLELQLRGSRSNEWIEQSRIMLNLFKLPEVEILDNVTDQVNLLMLTEHPEIFKQFSKEKKAKYRKMYRENKGMNNEYAKNAEKVFSAYIPNLQKEIDEFLAKLEQK